MPLYRCGVQIVMTGELEFEADDELHAEELVDDPSFVDDLLADQEVHFDRGVNVDPPHLAGG